jgi:uridine kinase
MKKVIFEKSCFVYQPVDTESSNNLRYMGNITISDPNSDTNYYHVDNSQKSRVREMLDNLKADDVELLLCSELGAKEKKELQVEPLLKDYFETVFSTSTIAARLREIAKAAGPEDLTVVVCSSDEIVEAAFRAGIPSIRIQEDSRKKIGTATLVADSVDQADDMVIQAGVFFEIARTISEKGCKVIGIDGIELVGKTYFSQKLMAFLELRKIYGTVVKLTDFRSPIEKNYVGEDEVEAFYFHGFNSNKLIEEILAPFKQNSSLNVTLRSFGDETDRYGREKQYRIDEGGVLLVEGVHMYREPLLEYFDLKIYLFMDDQEALHRALVRDIYLGEEQKVTEFVQKHIPAQKMYSGKHLPIEESDYAVDNTNHRRPKFSSDTD